MLCDDRTPTDYVWLKILSNDYDIRISEGMQSVIPALELNEYRFGALHKAVLQLTSTTLDETLQDYSPSNVNEVDSGGRTALSWAARRRDYDAMVLLLHNQADPHKADFLSRSPVQWAIRGGSLRCVRLLLSHGVTVNKADLFNKIPLYDIPNDPQFIHIPNDLFQQGPNVEHQSPVSASAIMIALEDHNTAFAKRLIYCYTDSHLKNQSDYTAASGAALFSIHSIIRLLLDQQADNHTNIEQHGSVLHLVIKTADIETLKMLTTRENNLAAGDVQVKRSDGLTTREAAKLRKDTILEWQNAFCAVLWRIGVRKIRVTPPFTMSSNNEEGHVDESGGEEAAFVDASE